MKNYLSIKQSTPYKCCPMKPISPTKGFWDRIKKLFK